MIDSVQQLQQQDAFPGNISSGYDFNFGTMQEQQPLPIHHITSTLTSLGFQQKEHHKAHHQTYQFIASKPSKIFIEYPPVYLENQSNNNEATAS
ncbi:6171_t:CDS:1, partial [Ambispora gerdemannii]